MEMLMVRQGNEDDRLSALERAFVALHSELRAEMDRRFNQVDERLDRMEERFDRRFEQIDRRLEQVDRRFEQVDRRFEQVDEKFERMYRLMVTVCASVVVTLIATCGGLVATQL